MELIEINKIDCSNGSIMPLILLYKAKIDNFCPKLHDRALRWDFKQPSFILQHFAFSTLPLLAQLILQSTSPLLGPEAAEAASSGM